MDLDGMTWSACIHKRCIIRVREDESKVESETASIRD
jgi:hypothetical protein